MDAGALIGTTELLSASRDMFPAQRKMLDAEKAAEVNGKDEKVLIDRPANGEVAKVITNGPANG